MTTIEVVMSLGGSTLVILIALFGNRMIAEVRGMRTDLQRYQLHMEKRMSRAEVEIEQLKQ